MKIYNEVITQFNDITGQWETMYEDSFEHNGPLMLAQGSLPNNATAISAQDTIADTIKVTAGYFTNGDGTLLASEIFTGSLADKNENYYFNVAQSTDVNVAEVQFSVAFGHIDGSGSNQYGDSTNNPRQVIGETQAIYKQLTNVLLEETEASGGFKISQGGSWSNDTANGVRGDALASGVADKYVYVFVGKRARFKDRINKKAWTMILSGSIDGRAGVSGKASIPLHLTDDSATVAAISTPAGPRHNIISGTLGVPMEPYTTRTYGWFYPEMGMMLFSGHELSASIPGAPNGHNITSSFSALMDHSDTDYADTQGFAPNLDAHNNAKNALRFVNCLRAAGDGETALRLRSEEDQSQENFFCRVKANQYNFSANPTFTSGSYNKIRAKDMHGNPTTFITGIGLYNSAGQLLAIAKLSSPLKKNFASEATIKVKLTY
jgi:hypothetical protein